MDRYIVKNGKKLRYGYTTGSCAAAASKASATMLLSGVLLNSTDITLPGGEQLTMEINDPVISGDYSSCSVIKDGGDDPDATTGMKIYSRVTLVRNTHEISVEGGTGIGRVTRSGLPCPPGLAAINPVPMKMIRGALKEAAERFRYKGGFKVLIYAPEGVRIAEKTFNPRLGIVGGISILGTTGIVEPMSEAAIIDTIKLEINSKVGEEVLLISPGNYGLDFSRENLGLNIDRAVKCSNFIGEALDHALYCGFEKIMLIGHIGKLAKIAAGIMNTHSKAADGRKEICVAHAALCGADVKVLRSLMDAATMDEMHMVLAENHLDKQVYKNISEQIAFQLDHRLQGKAQIEFLIFSKEYGVLMKSQYAELFINEIKEYRQ